MTLPHEAGRTGRTAWDRYGEGDGVPLVALHGWSDSGACWTPSVPAWAVGRVVLTIDARGHGRTPLPDEPFTIAALAGDAARVIRAVLGRAAVVVGHSMGGLVAEELALSVPELVAALVLEDPAWRVGRDVDARGVPRGLRDGMRRSTGTDATVLRSDGRAQNPTWPDDELDPWVASTLDLAPGLADVPHEWDGRDWAEALAELDVPVTLLTGLPDRGAIVDADQVSRACVLLGSRLTHVPLVTGHCVRREARPAVEAAVAAALARADGARAAHLP